MSKPDKPWMTTSRPSLARWLRLRWLWLSHFYSFHWAHKPLCDRFRSDVFQFTLSGRRVSVCRSCTLLYVTLVVTATLLLSIRFLASDTIINAFIASYAPIAYLATGAMVIVLSLPAWYKHWPRAGRDLLRAGAGGVLALNLYLLFTDYWLPGLLGGVVIMAFWKVYGHQRQQRKRHACDGCHEYGSGEICSGFVDQAQLVRSYEERATELLNP